MSLEMTALIESAAKGDREAVNSMLPVVYDELRGFAADLLAEREPLTLQPTALVHEVYLKLVGSAALDWRSRTHFRAIAAQAMRQVLIDHGRGRNRAKRGGNAARVTLCDGPEDRPSTTADCQALDAALGRLREQDERAAEVVVLRFLGGLDERAIAEVLGVSERTVRRDWTMARAWLHCELVDDLEG